MRILIVKLSALGDILHAMPAVRRLLHEGHETSWAVDARYSEVLDLFPGLSQVHILDPKGWGRAILSGRFREGFGPFRASLVRIRSVRYDLALDLQGLVKSALVARAAGARRVAGFAASVCRERASALFYGERFAVDLSTTVSRQIMSVVSRATGVAERMENPNLAVPDEALRQAGVLTDGMSGSPAIVVVGAGWPTKVLPAQSLRRVVEALAAGGPVLALSGSREEHDVARFVTRGVRCARVLHRLSMAVLAGIFSRSRVVVGGDTGLIHLAAFMGAPTVSFYGASLGERSGPEGARHRHIQSEAECSPCFRRRCRKIVCMEVLDPERIVSSANEVAN